MNKLQRWGYKKKKKERREEELLSLAAMKTRAGCHSTVRSDRVRAGGFTRGGRGRMRPRQHRGGQSCQLHPHTSPPLRGDHRNTTQHTFTIQTFNHETFSQPENKQSDPNGYVSNLRKYFEVVHNHVFLKLTGKSGEQQKESTPSGLCWFVVHLLLFFYMAKSILCDSQHSNLCSFVSY